MRCARACSSSWPGWASWGCAASASSPAARRAAVDEIAADDDSDDGDGRRRHGCLRGRRWPSSPTRWAAEAPSVPPPAPGRLAQLRRRYHELGAANPYAVDEYAELKVRLETLETQGADLRSAIEKTRELIGELDTMIATQFRTTFEALESAFERRFEQLFGGGFARLSLTDPTDLGSTGVEIVARPPGKKAQALAMLSGGERALTAVALLFAMLEVRPVPFCVLDEVDAALDEANIGRFADALRSLAAPDPVHRDHPQPRHDRGGRRAVRRDRRRRLGVAGDQPAARRGPGAGGRARPRVQRGRLMPFWRRRREEDSRRTRGRRPTDPSREPAGRSGRLRGRADRAESALDV